jgi:hypothetical protein
MSLKDKIVDTKPRERSGSISGSRFDYQKDWSICKLIESHASQSDFVIIFDWHEDLIIMDSEHNPQKVSFYQIKGKKSGNWTIKQLLESEVGKGGTQLLSIIGKLYDCKTKFELETTSLNFVSNARFSVDLEDKSSSLSKDSICIIELSSGEKEVIKNKIKIEHGLSFEPIFEDITFLEVLDLSLNDSPTHTKGKISNFLDNVSPDKKFNVSSVYRMLFDEVKRRASYNKDIINYNDLLTNKAICKSQFDKIIDATGIKKDYDEIWKRAEATLQNDGLKFQEIKKLRQSWNQLELERMNPKNDYLNIIIESIKSISAEMETKGVFESKSLIQIIDLVLRNFNSLSGIRFSYDDNFIKSIIISEIYD